MVLYLDLSISSTGYVLADEDSIYDIGSIKTHAKDSTPLRLHKIRIFLQEIKQNNEICEVVIERGFTRFNKATQQLYRVHGVVNELFWDVDQIYYSPKELKKLITGKGNANKKEVMAAVLELFPEYEGINEDEADALALMYTDRELRKDT